MKLLDLGTRLAVTAIVTGVGMAIALPAAAAPVTVYSSKQATVLGKVLVSGSGRTLYHYSSEPKNAVKCTGACAVKWPPLLIGTGLKPIAGPGATASLLGTVKRPDGKLQVTYRGLALYLFSGDKKAGDVKGQGNGASWYAIAPSGLVVKKAATTSTGTGKTGSGSGSTGGGSTGGGSTGGGGTGGGGTGGTSVDCNANPAADGCGM